MIEEHQPPQGGIFFHLAKGSIVKLKAGDWVLIEPHIVAVQQLHSLDSVLVHLSGGTKFSFIGNEATALWKWARRGAVDLLKGKRATPPQPRNSWGTLKAGAEELHPGKAPIYRKWGHRAA